MEQDLVGGKIGSIGEYDVEFKDGKLIAKVDILENPGPGVSFRGEVSVEIGAAAVLDALKKAIPGTIDDALLDLLAKALGL